MALRSIAQLDIARGNPRCRGAGAWFAAAAGALLAGGTAQAAQQGTIAQVSRGSVVITASVAARASVSGVTDVALGPADAAGTLAAEEHLCVSGNSLNGRYDLIASGNTEGADFALTAKDGSTTPLALSWTDSSGAKLPLLPGMPLRRLDMAAPSCSPIETSTLAMTAPAGDQPVAGTLTITIAPL